MIWPPHFPENCPPSSSRPAQGVVYRFTEGETPAPEDFRSFKELRPEEDFGTKDCQSCGVSVLSDFGEVQAMARRVPAYRAKHAARATLAAELGMILPTPTRDRKSHKTWWIPLGVEAWKTFQIIPLQEGGGS